jgi:hypothetical protein
MKRAALIILCIQGSFGALAQDVVIPKDTSNIQKIGIYYVDTSKYYVTNQLSSFAVFVKGYEFWEKEDWVNYKKHFPDSCTAIYPFVEDVSILKAKLMKRKILSSNKDSIDISHNIVPWYAILREYPLKQMRFPYLFRPQRTYNLCPECNHRLYILKVFLPDELRVDKNRTRLYRPYILYCEHCNQQVGITDIKDVCDLWLHLRGKDLASLPRRVRKATGRYKVSTNICTKEEFKNYHNADNK